MLLNPFHSKPLAVLLTFTLWMGIPAVSCAAVDMAALSQQIQVANDAANSGDYRAAIQGYEHVIQALPAGDPQRERLEKNLLVLYFNEGSRLQKLQQYPAAEACFDKILAHNPNDPHAKKGKASNRYYQASALMDEALQNGSFQPGAAMSAEARKPLFDKMHGLIDEAIALAPDEKAYENRKIYLWMTEAQLLGDEEQFDQAIALVQKAHQRQPNEPTIQMSLATLYLHKAKSAEGKEQKEWLDKALATDPSETTQQRAEQIRNAGKSSGGLLSRGGSQSSGVTPAAMDHPFLAQSFAKGTQATAAQPSALMKPLPEMLSEVERSLGLNTNTSNASQTPSKASVTLADVAQSSPTSLIERVERLEQAVTGSAKTGALLPRVQALYAQVVTSNASKAASAQHSSLTLAQIDQQEQQVSYLDNVMQMTDGKVIRWGRFPLRVFIVDPPKSEIKRRLQGYQETYPGEVVKALDAWKLSTQGFFNYMLVKNPQAADIIVDWESDYQDPYLNAEAKGNTKTGDPKPLLTKVVDDEKDLARLQKHYDKLAPPKPSRLAQVLQVASMFTPGMFSLIPQVGAAALQYKNVQHYQALLDESKVTLGVNALAQVRTTGEKTVTLRELSPDAAHTVIYNQALKEIGHALGLKALSEQPQDAVSAEIPLTHRKTPSPRDLTTLQELYSRPATLVLNMH